MVMTWFDVAVMFQLLFLLSIVFNFRESLIARWHGIRFKRWIELDTGRYGYVIRDKSLTTGKVLGKVRTINSDNIINGWMFFTSDSTENLKLENAEDKWEYYSNSEEFDTVFKNKILQQLMIVMERNWIMIIVALVAIDVLMQFYSIYSSNQDTQRINYLVSTVQTYLQGAGQ